MAHENELLNRPGGCLIFSWGPPWNWIPSVQRSRYGAGVSLTWLAWGLHYHPRSVGDLLFRATRHRLDEKPQGQ